MKATFLAFALSIISLFTACVAPGELDVKHYKNGSVLCEGRRVEGKKEGPWKFFHSNGKPHSRSTYRMGRRVGTWHRWDESGHLIERSEWDGTFHGHCERWWPNGNKSNEGDFIRGDKTGPWKFWNEDGSLDRSRSGNYINGKKR